ncbi:MAG: nucleotide exchange factor GrpE [Candidatus Thorarchaeota archaeon]|nr:MAG: nucleotide exchange factor GrpE [Candidatus Thorarchaeota archaeon]
MHENNEANKASDNPPLDDADLKDADGSKPAPDEEEITLEVETVEDDLQERLRRLQAEFDNYRKRIESRFSDAAQFASESILLRFMEVLDNLERALGADFAEDPDAAREGVAAIVQQIVKILEQEHVRPIESTGKQFDPFYQHAVAKSNDPDVPDGMVVEEIQRGYMIRERVLRPALVVVNRHVFESVAEDTSDVEIEVDLDFDDLRDEEEQGE